MGKPLLIRIFHHTTNGIKQNIDELSQIRTIPSQYIYDNHIFYGEYPIIGNLEMPKVQIDFPISYGRVLYASSEVYLQWGLIHKQKSVRLYDKHLTGINKFVSEYSPSYKVTNPYSKNSIGFQLVIDKKTILECVELKSNKPY